MSSATISSPKKTKTPSVVARWDDDNSRILLELLENEIARGNRPSGILSKTGWFNVIENFKIRTGLVYNKDQLKNRLDNLRRDYVKWEKLIGRETGLGWDNQKRTLAAPESWWYERAKSDLGILKYKDGHLVNLELMQKVFAGVAATGKYAYNPFTSDVDPLLDAGDRVEKLDEIIDFTADTEWDLPVLEINNNEIIPPAATSTPASSKIRLQKRKRLSTGGRVSEVDKYSATVESLTNTIRESMTVYSKSKTIDGDSVSYSNAIDVLQTLPGMDTPNPLFMKAVRILEDKMKRVAFMAMVKMGNEAVLRWLDTFPGVVP